MEKKENIVKLVKATPIELRCSLNGVMDDLCDTLEKLTPLDGYEETDLLKYSSSLTLNELASSDYLMKSGNRYKKYLKYANGDFSNYYGEVILFLISDFLATCHTPSLLLASKCVSIDLHIFDMIQSTERNKLNLN